MKFVKISHNCNYKMATISTDDFFRPSVSAAVIQLARWAPWDYALPKVFADIVSERITKLIIIPRKNYPAT